MYLIIIGEETPRSFSSKKTFDLWYLYGSSNIIDLWKSGATVASCIDSKKVNAYFSSLEEWKKVLSQYGLYAEDFDIPIEFCRKKNIPSYPDFWAAMRALLFSKRIWVHRGSELGGTQ